MSDDDGRAGRDLCAWKGTLPPALFLALEEETSKAENHIHVA